MWLPWWHHPIESLHHQTRGSAVGSQSLCSLSVALDPCETRGLIFQPIPTFPGFTAQAPCIAEASRGSLWSILFPLMPPGKLSLQGHRAIRGRKTTKTTPRLILPLFSICSWMSKGANKAVSSDFPVNTNPLLVTALFSPQTLSPERGMSWGPLKATPCLFSFTRCVCTNPWTHQAAFHTVPWETKPDIVPLES